MAVNLGNLRGSLTAPIGRVQRSLDAWTLQEQAGHTLESMLGSEVEERWHVCIAAL